jgi:hypothetical protein
MNDKTRHGKELWVKIYELSLPLFQPTHSGDALKERCAIEANKALKEYNKIFGGYNIEVNSGDTNEF